MVVKKRIKLVRTRPPLTDEEQAQFWKALAAARASLAKDRVRYGEIDAVEIIRRERLDRP